MPNAAPNAAIELLRGDDFPRVLAWLEILPSSEPSSEERFRSGCLTYQRLNALSTIQNYSDDQILAWLHHAGQAGQWSYLLLS